MSCKCAIATDEYHGWECEITGGACMFLFPDGKLCAKEYGEVVETERKCRICGCTWHNACHGGCYWVEEDLCSACVEGDK